MELKSQGLLVLFKVGANPGRRRDYAALAQALSMRALGVHVSVKRAVANGPAASRGRGEWSPLIAALPEFVVHGVRYVWPAIEGHGHPGGHDMVHPQGLLRNGSGADLLLAMIGLASRRLMGLEACNLGLRGRVGAPWAPRLT